MADHFLQMHILKERCVLFADVDPLWVEKYVAFIKNKTFFRLEGPAYPIGIFKIFNIQAENNHGINVTDFTRG